MKVWSSNVCWPGLIQIYNVPINVSQKLPTIPPSRPSPLVSAGKIAISVCPLYYTVRNTIVPWTESLQAGFYGFHCCERRLYRHHDGSHNSKRTHTTKSICQVLTSHLTVCAALDIWGRAHKIAQTLVCSQIRQFTITFARFISNYCKKSLRL